MGGNKHNVNDTTLSQHQIEAVARCIFPDIVKFYNSEEGQREFAEWMEQRETEQETDITT